MKKILSYVIVLVMLTGLFAFPVSVGAAQDEAALTTAEEVFMGLGIVDKDNYNPEALLSRAEFATLISELCNFVPDNKAYMDNMEISFGSDNKDSLITSSGEKTFEDVDSTMDEYEAIMAVCSKGYMNGITSRLFGPYYDITAGEVIKVVVSMLGREQFAIYKGGYPSGYMEVARSIKLTSGLSLGATDFINMREALGLIFNAFDIDVYEVTGITADGDIEYTQSGKTFLSHCAEVYTLEGTMTDNGITTFFGKSKVGSDMVVIGGEAMYAGDADYLRSLLGRELVAYYTEDKSGKKYLEYASVEKSSGCTFDAQDFVSYSSSAIKYYDENGKLTTATLSRAGLIYNNTVLERYGADIFSFLYGDVTLVSTSGNKVYDVVIINDYSVGKIKKISAADKVIYSDTLYSDMTDIRTLNLKEESGKTIVITDHKGTKMDFDSLSVGDVISVAKSGDSKYISIKVCSANVSAFCITDYSISDNLEVSDGQTSYLLKGVSSLIEPVIIKPGELYDLYLDSKGNIIYIEELADSSDFKKAFLADAAADGNGFDDLYAVRLCTEDGKLVAYHLDEKVMLNRKSKEASDAFEEIKNSIGKVVLYRADKDEKILKAIITPLNFGAKDSDNRGWYAVIPHIRLSAEVDETQEQFSKYLTDYATANRYVYESNGGMLDKSMMYDANRVTLFGVPSTRKEYDEEKKFYVNRIKFETNKGYYLNAYDTNPDAIVPDVIAFSSGSGAASGDTISERNAFIITKIVSTMNSDEEIADAYKGYFMSADGNALTEATYTVSNDVEYVDADNKIVAKEIELEAGDIIRFGTNSDGEISSIFVAYDKSKKQPYPFGLKSLDWYGGDTYTGYVYSVDNGYARITADEPHLVPEAPDKLHAYFTSRDTSLVHNIGKTILIVEEGRNGVTVRKGTSDDIVTYKESGSLNSGEYDRIVGIGYAWGYTIATIIYK